MQNFTGTDYIDALMHEDADFRYAEATRILLIDNLVEAGTDEYYDYARMRLNAKKEIMGSSPRTYTRGFTAERNNHHANEWMKAGR